MNWLYIFLHVLLDLIFVEVLEAAVVNHLFCSFFFTRSLLFDDICTKSTSGSWCLTRVSANFFKRVMTLALQLHSIQLFLMVAIDVKDVNDWVGTSHEIRMIRVNISVLYSDQVPYHLVCRAELFWEQFIHDLYDLTAQILKSRQLLHFNFAYDSAQFFINELHALERWWFKPINLLLWEHFEGDFGHEKVWTQWTSIANGVFDGDISERVERINVANGRRVVLIENVIQPAATFEFDICVFHESTFDELTVRGRVLRNDVQYQLLFCLITILANLQTTELFFFLVKHGCDFRSDDWQTLLNMFHDYHVKCSAEVWSSKAWGKRCVDRVRLEIALFRRQSLWDRFTRKSILLWTAHYTNVAKPERIYFSLYDIYTVSALIHKVNFGKHAYRTLALRIHASRKFKCVWVCKVHVGRRHSANDRRTLLDIKVADVEDLALYVIWLATLWDFRHTRQVYKR